MKSIMIVIMQALLVMMSMTAFHGDAVAQDRSVNIVGNFGGKSGTASNPVKVDFVDFGTEPSGEVKVNGDVKPNWSWVKIETVIEIPPNTVKVLCDIEVYDDDGKLRCTLKRAGNSGKCGPCQPDGKGSFADANSGQWRKP